MIGQPRRRSKMSSVSGVWGDNLRYDFGSGRSDVRNDAEE
jgi:hypothetical protein